MATRLPRACLQSASALRRFYGGQLLSIAFLLLSAAQENTASDKPDCAMGVPKEWDDFKQSYCCENPPYICAPYDKGCDTPCLYMNATVSCRARIHFKRQWAFKKKDDGCLWAYWLVMDQCTVCNECTAVQAGCPHHPWDCTGDPDQEKWSPQLREFCCLKQGKTCPKLQAFDPSKGFDEVPFDCQDHQWDWNTSWSHEHRKWCCWNQQIGCNDMQGEAPRIEVAVSDADFQIMQAAREAAGAAVAPSTTTQAANPSELYDCGSIETNYLSVYWPEEKRQWCCEHEQIGCDDVADSQEPDKPASAQLYDCHAGTKTLHQSWSKAKKDWCCQQMVIGCEEDTKPTGGAIEADLYGSGDSSMGDYDCTVEANSWRTSWSDGQKKACCKKIGIGCESDGSQPNDDYGQEAQADSGSEPTEGTSGFFDCSKGLPEQWSDSKMQVCGIYQMQ